MKDQFVQNQIFHINSLAHFVPCSYHCLNVLGLYNAAQLITLTFDSVEKRGFQFFFSSSFSPPHPPHIYVIAVIGRQTGRQTIHEISNQSQLEHFRAPVNHVVSPYSPFKQSHTKDMSSFGHVFVKI